MAREEKVQRVEQLAELLRRSSIAIVTDYRGMTVADLSALRAKLRQAGVDYHVAKNTLARFAAERTGRDGMVRYLEGPTAIAFGLADPVDAAKALVDYVRTAKLLSVKGATLDGRVLTADEVNRLAELPPKAEPLAQVVGGIQAPISGLVGILSAPIQALLGTLESRRQQLEAAAG